MNRRGAASWERAAIRGLAFLLLLGLSKARAQTKVTDAEMMTATGGQFFVYVQGRNAKTPQGHRPGPDEGTQENNINVDIVEGAMERETLLAVKEKEAIGPGRKMILSYLLTVKLDNGAEKTFNSSDREAHKVWFDPDGLHQPPPDALGHQWTEFDYDDSDPGWKKGEDIARNNPPFGGIVEVKDGRTRLPFLSGAPQSTSTTKNSVQYFRRKLVLWGKPSPPTATPVNTLTYTPAPTRPPQPTATIRPSSTVSTTKTSSPTATRTSTLTFTKTFSPTPKPDEPTWTPSPSVPPTLSLTAFITDTPVPSEPPTAPPTPAQTFTPTESPQPTAVPPTSTPSPAPGFLILGFETEKDLELRNGGFAEARLWKGPQGLTQGKACGEFRFRTEAKFRFTPSPGPFGRATPTPRPYSPVLYLYFEGPARPRTTDYSLYKTLSLDVTNPGKMPVNITLGLGDASGKQMAFKGQGATGEAMTRIQGELQEARNQRLDLRRIQFLSIAVDVTGQPQDPRLYLDNLRLE